MRLEYLLSRGRAGRRGVNEKSSRWPSKSCLGAVPYRAAVGGDPALSAGRPEGSREEFDILEEKRHIGEKRSQRKLATKNQT